VTAVAPLTVSSISRSSRRSDTILRSLKSAYGGLRCLRLLRREGTPADGFSQISQVNGEAGRSLG
jgi:hypothetical protein